MISQINSNLKQAVPYYSEASELTLKTLEKTFKTANSIQSQIGSKIDQTKKNVRTFKQALRKEILSLVESASNQLLTRTQKILLSEEQRPSESEKKLIKKRFYRIYSKIINDYIIFYLQEARKWNLELMVKGKGYIYHYVLPMYIKLKATIIVSKQILLEMIQNGIDDMKMTYTVSKDTVTMLIRGQFDEDKIIENIYEKMDNFKELTVKVVKKGLQIKVDKKSLYQNYQIFSSKILEAIRDMREKGTQKIVSAKQKTTALYRNVLNRIRQKEIILKMEYKELKDDQQNQLKTMKDQCQ